MKKTVTYVLVADGARARIYVNEGPGKGLQAVSGATHKADLHHHSRDVKSDKPGRAIDAGTGQRSAMEPSQDWHRFEKHKFAREMAKVIDAAAANKAFDRLILVAPPTTICLSIWVASWPSRGTPDWWLRRRLAGRYTGVAFR